jgi:hypothetical protein
MSCCGRKRHAVAPPTRNDGPGVTIEYRGRGGADVAIVGVTGRSYVFSDASPIQTVHPRDARRLLRSAGFRLV